jgi:hypothetical protein
MSEAWIALIGTLFGGAGFKIIEHFLGRRASKEDFATKLRGELHAELTQLRHEIDEARDEADEWRGKFYSIVGYVASGDLQGALRKIKEMDK